MRGQAEHDAIGAGENLAGVGRRRAAGTVKFLQSLRVWIEADDGHAAAQQPLRQGGAEQTQAEQADGGFGGRGVHVIDSDGCGGGKHRVSAR